MTTLLLAITCSSQTAHAQLIDSTAKPVPFAPGIASTPYDEWALTFTPDGNTFYSSQGGMYWTIVFSRKKDGKWSRPQVAPFSGQWNDTDPFITPDGKKLFYVSNRPPEGTPQDKPNKNFHLWYVDRLPDGQWSAPHHLGAPVNIEGVNNYGPSVSRNGTLCFCARERDGNKDMCGYAATWNGSSYDKPVRLVLNGNGPVQDPFISADERYIVFLSNNDLLVSWRQAGGGWSDGQNLGPIVNNGDGNSSPYVSADGRTLYYSSNRVKGMFSRDRSHALNYDQLVKEMDNIFNGRGNILMIPINLSAPHT